MTSAVPRKLWVLVVFLLVVVSPAGGQQGDKPGEEQIARVAPEKIPPAPALSPAAALKTFQLKPGFRIELVAAEPMVEEPVAIAFDPDGRLWVLEMRGYMPNLEGTGEKDIPGRVTCLEDVNGDGQMDKRTVFLDQLVMPRAFALVAGGVLVAEPPRLWFCRDTDGDGVSDRKTEVVSGYGTQSNPEQNANGLMRDLDNWLYSANHTVRYRQDAGQWRQEPTAGRGQWGITQDDFGRLFFNSNSDQLRADFYPAHYTEGNPAAKLAGLNARVASDQSTFPSRVTPGVNRGYQKGILREDGTLAKFTAACSPVIYRGDNFPAEFRGNAFVCEPSAHLVKRNILSEQGGLITARHAYPDSEFLTSSDERFRPVNLANGPDGALYVVDMYHGILQHHLYLTTYLRQQIESRSLQTPLHQGRIYRVVSTAYPPGPRPTLNRENSRALINRLSHPNGWWRDTAQQLLVERAEASVVPSLRHLASSHSNDLARLHALYTLEGLHQLDAKTLERACDDHEPRIRAAALRLSEPFWDTHHTDAARLKQKAFALATDPAPEVQTQVALSLGRLKEPAAADLLKKLQLSSYPLTKDAASFSLAKNVRAKPAATKTLVAKLTPDEQKQFDLGKTVYETACLVCHQPHGLGQEGLAPPLVESEWLAGPDTRLIRIVLHGLRGPLKVKGQTYELDMPALSVLDDEQIAAVLSYVRREWGHSFPFVAVDSVKKLRAATAERDDAWTEEELKRIQ